MKWWTIVLVFASLNATAQVRDSVVYRTDVPIRLQSLPADYATKHYGFFCRQELKLDKVTPVPVRFRLGSQAECDRLEGKTR